jgi:hypothetical protein
LFLQPFFGNLFGINDWLDMGVKSYSFENDRLAIEFDDSIRTVFIEGEIINGVFNIRTEKFETHPGLSYSDKKDIRKTILNDNRVVID